MARGGRLQAACKMTVVIWALLVLASAAQARSLAAADPGTAMATRLTKAWLSNKQLDSWAKEFLGRCGHIAKLHDVGKSSRGNNMWFLEISDRPGDDEPEPNFKYIANMHGNEISGRMLLPRLAEWLCENNGKDARATRLVRDFHIYLMPTMNPDGYPRRRNNRSKDKGKPGGYDLNRNFPDQYADKGQDLTKPAADTQPEVAAVMKFSLERPWLAASNFHEGELLVNYPWDGNPELDINSHRNNPAPDDATFRWLGKAYGTLNPAMASRGWLFGTVNGNSWYPVFGGMQDWDYINAGSMHFTIECSLEQGPKPTEIPTLWDQNRDALLELPLKAYQGVRGTVKEAATGRPLPAKLFVRAGATAPIPFRASPVTGFYARPLAPGVTYTLVATMAGFEDSEVQVAVPSNGLGVVQNFELRRTA